MSATEGAGRAASDNTAVRPFQVGFPVFERASLACRIVVVVVVAKTSPRYCENASNWSR
jgi:hypothetical protein